MYVGDVFVSVYVCVYVYYVLDMICICRGLPVGALFALARSSPTKFIYKYILTRRCHHVPYTALSLYCCV